MKRFCFGFAPQIVSLLTIGLLVTASASTSSAAPALVADISPSDAFPDRLVNLDGVLLFVADDGTNGVELWKSDGTPAGTVMVTDINPGGDADPGATTGLVVYGGAIYFDADDGTNGVELWKSDGTATGTVLVKDIRAGGNDSNPSSLTVVGSQLLFAATDGTVGIELWKSDGSGANTVLVSDINPLGSSGPGRILDVNGTAYFVADDGTNGIELWKSDGTGAGTTLVRDINAGALLGSNPSHLVNVSGSLFFAANDGVSGNELWKSDGTAAGTVMVADLRAGLPSSSPGNAGMVNAGGTLFFDANDGIHGRELWKSDGSAAGTVLVKDINMGGGSAPGSLGGIVNVNGTLFFDADDGIAGNELWKSDGTGDGTVLVKDVEAGAAGSDPAPIVNINGTVAMNACDTASGCELWWSDGTAAGTTQAADILAGAGDGDPQQLTNVAGTLFFSADDGTSGVELWGNAVCTSIDPMIPGCLPATAGSAKCSSSLSKLTLKLLASDRKCALKNSDAAVGLGTYEGQACEDVARYRFLGSIASLQLKDPACAPTCFGSGDVDSRATEIEASVDALHGAIYCDATSAIPQDDGFGGFLPDAASEDCANGMAKLAGSLSKSIVSCNSKKVSALLKAASFDLAACQAAAMDKFDTGAAALSGCPSCLRAAGIRDEVVTQSNSSDSSSAYCRNELF